MISLKEGSSISSTIPRPLVHSGSSLSLFISVLFVLIEMLFIDGVQPMSQKELLLLWESRTCQAVFPAEVNLRKRFVERMNESSQTMSAREPTKGMELEDCVKIQRIGAKAMSRIPNKAKKQI